MARTDLYGQASACTGACRNENSWHLWFPGIFHRNVGNITWSTAWWSCSTTPAWMLTVVESNSWLGWSTPWKAASGSILSPQAGDGQRRLSSFEVSQSNLQTQKSAHIGCLGLFSFTVFAVSLKGLCLNWERVQEHKTDGFIFRFVISSSLMDSKHQKATTQKMENTTFSRWGWKCGKNLLSGLQSRNTTWINNRRFSFVSTGILSTFTHEYYVSFFNKANSYAFKGGTFREEAIAEIE